MSDYVIIVESKENPKAKKIRNEYEHMFQAMDKIYEVINNHPGGSVTVHREWDFGKAKE